MKFRLLILMASLFSFSLYAICTEGELIDHRSPAFFDKSSKTHLVRDQQWNNWCYAFTASDLVTHYLFNNAKERIPREFQFVSPLSLVSHSVNGPVNKGTFFTDTNSGGQITQWLMDQFTLPRSGVCLESEVRSSNMTLPYKGRPIQIPKMLNIMEDKYRSSLKKRKNVTKNDPWLKHMQLIFPKMRMSELQSAINIGIEKRLGGAQFISSLIKRNCRNPLKIKSLPKIKRIRRNLIENNTDNRDVYLKELKNQLRSNNIVGVEYNSYLIDKDFREGRMMSRPHVSSIVGEKCSGGRTYYLIRNSYSNNCQEKGYRQGIECDQGNIWVTEELLLKMSTRISFL
jgi:hypothetical protein